MANLTHHTPYNIVNNFPIHSYCQMCNYCTHTHTHTSSPSRLYWVYQASWSGYGGWELSGSCTSDHPNSSDGRSPSHTHHRSTENPLIHKISKFWVSRYICVRLDITTIEAVGCALRYPTRPQLWFPLPTINCKPSLPTFPFHTLATPTAPLVLKIKHSAWNTGNYWKWDSVEEIVRIPQGSQDCTRTPWPSW